MKNSNAPAKSWRGARLKNAWGKAIADRQPVKATRANETVQKRERGAELGAQRRRQSISVRGATWRCGEKGKDSIKKGNANGKKTAARERVLNAARLKL